METQVKLRSTNEVEGKWVKNRDGIWKKKKYGSKQLVQSTDELRCQTDLKSCFFPPQTFLKLKSSL